MNKSRVSGNPLRVMNETTFQNQVDTLSLNPPYI